MKKYIISMAAIIAVMAAVSTGCADDNELALGEGRVTVSTSISTDVKVQSRAETTAELAENCMVWISKKDKGLVRRYDHLADIPADGIKLMSGEYVAEAWTGDSVPASWDKRWFKGSQPFTVQAGATTNVNVVCKVANVVASVAYSDQVKDVLSDYTMTIGHNRGSLEYVGDTDAKGYFMMPSTDKNLTWTLSGTLADGSPFTKTGVIENAAPATWYKLNVKYTGSDIELGGGYITIEVDQSAVNNEDTVVIEMAPDISGFGFDISKQLMAEKGNVGRCSFFVRGTTPLTDIVIANDNLDAMLGIGGNDINLLKMSSDIAATIAAKGVTLLDSFSGVTAGLMYKVSFEDTFTSALAEGEHRYSIRAVDSNGKEATATLIINVSDAAVITYDIVPADVWATSATITGAIIKDTATNVKMRYRRLGAAEWTDVEYTRIGNALSAILTGLTDATTYEYAVVCDETPSPVPMTFTTEMAKQLPNCGFEDWQQPGGSNATLIYASGDDMFWDSGNHGSAKMSKQVTTPDAGIKHGGAYSAKLASQFVGVGSIGAFAAGNIFVGQFLGTENTTKGILGWGRPWTTRPKALRGYIKYTPQNVTYSSTDKISKGDLDRGIIYIALVDGSTMSYGSYSGWPQIVATKDINNYSFNKDGANVIAYGEKIFTEAVGGESSMVQFEIPLEYVRTDIKPSNIIITCSASQYGDYYSGGPSVMYLDDFELVY
ncbi:MAG: DUF4493 domain-containing protein [Muribaculaceae bacterium]